MLIAFWALAIFGCAPTSTPSTPTTLTISGTAVATSALFPALVEQHAQDVGSLRFSVVTYNNQEAMDQFLSQDVTIAAMDRPHRPAEQEQAVANGHSLEDDGSQHILAVDAVAVAVHADTSLHSLTYDQVIDIFCTGLVTNWSQLGFEPEPISLMLPPAQEGARMVFEDFFCGPAGMVPNAEIGSRSAISQRLANRPGTVSIVSFAERSGKLLGLRPDGESKPLMPTQSNVIRGIYPLAYDLLLYTRAPLTGPAKEFIRWIHSQAGQAIVEEQRFVPLYARPDRLDGPRPLRETIHFDINAATPTARSMARLNVLIKDLEGRAGDYSHVVLEGFTDTTEGDNFPLATQRAEVVREHLFGKLPELEFEVIPRGTRDPIAPNETPYGRQRNRRVQVYVEKNAVE